ncbi:MAG TPA: hypothetical protein VFQ41_10760 [Candidatus Angelobacter sp.]|nr:hypothetical protein [Candidatus Angelobacter sp.]
MLANDVDTQRIEIFSLCIVALGVIVVLFYSGLSKSTASWLLCAGAFFAVGMATGFIFAIPRASGRYVNSNLELISDWLTKILVGVGLTQLREIPGGLARLAQYVAGGSTSSGHEQSFAFFVILYFFFGGFVDAYLETRVFLTGAFIRSEPQDKRTPDEDHDTQRSLAL